MRCVMRIVMTMVSIVMGIRILVKPFFAMKDQEIHPERIKRRHKNTC